MLKRTLPIVLLLAVPALARADDVKKAAQAPPTIIVRLASLDGILERLQLVGSLVGNEDLAKKLDASLKKAFGKKGLTGIDSKLPIGLYARVGADISDISGVLMVPIPGAEQFKEMLEDLGWEVREDKDGLYAVKQNLVPLDVQYRLANGYAYIGLQGLSTLTPESLLTPQKIFGASPSAAALSLTLRLDQVPASLRGMILDTLTEGLAKVEGKPGESKAQKALRQALTKEIVGLLDNVLKEGEELTAQIDLDPQTKQLAVDLSLTAKAHTKLAEKIAKLGQRRTLFAGVFGEDAALNGLINIEVPGEVRKALVGVVQESMNKALATMSDDGKKQRAIGFFNALRPTFTGTDLDAAFSLRGPSKSKLFTLVAGFKLQQGEGLAATLLELTKNLPDTERGALVLNADHAGDVAIHRLALPATAATKTAEMFGGYPVFLALREDALFLALGEDGLAAIKRAVATPATLAPPLQLDVCLSRLAGAMETDETTAKAAQALLQAGDDARLRVSLEGGAALRLKLTMDLSALKISRQEKKQ